jgi:dihydroorotate dehydrogenase electron transfer subunit
MTKRLFNGKILGNEEIAAQIYKLVLQNEESVIDSEPGQFVNIYLNDKSMLLPRPISICSTDMDRLTLVYKIVGNGTKVLSGCQSGDVLKISSPLGHGFDLNAIFSSLEDLPVGNTNASENNIAADDGNGAPAGRTKTIALVAGGLGVPPMYELAKAIRSRLHKKNEKIRLIAALGFQKEGFLIDEMKRQCDEVFLSTEDGSSGFRGNVLDLLKAGNVRTDYILSCGPKPMLRALAEHCGKQDIPFQVSLEERMGCGYGACVGCICKTKEAHQGTVEWKQKKVCKDGPVFFGNEVVWDEV